VGLSGTAYAKWATRFAEYAEGESPLELVPVDGGAAIPFMHQDEETKAEVTEAGLLRTGVLEVMVRQRLTIGALYIYRALTWQVAATNDDVMAGTDWPHRAELVRHAA
jgi:hypothetical protein